MKKTLLTFLVLGFFLSGFSQTWVPVGNGISAGGYVRTLFVYDSVMYAGGYFSSPGNSIAQWNGTTWDSLGSGINDAVYAIGIYKGTIYMGGYFSEAGGHSAGCITEWNGKSFSNTGLNFKGGEVDAIQAYDSLLYIGGQYTSVNLLNYLGIISWDGNKIDTVVSRTYWSNTSILIVYNNLLVAGFSPTNNPSVTLTWNNKVSKILGMSTDGYFFQKNFEPLEENAFCQTNGNLYMGGAFSTHNSFFGEKLNNIAKWNGTVWKAVGKGINGIVYSLASYNNLIVAGGSFDSAGGVPASNLAAWDGSNWAPLGSGFNGPVYALAVFDSNLYAGGDFTSPASGIAVYKKVPVPPIIGSATLFPNPSNGIFTIQLSSINLQLSVKVYNILGQMIYSATYTSQTAQIDLSRERSGMYFYRISSANGKAINTGKFVIE